MISLQVATFLGRQRKNFKRGENTVGRRDEEKQSRRRPHKAAINKLFIEKKKEKKLIGGDKLCHSVQCSCIEANYNQTNDKCYEKGKL